MNLEKNDFESFKEKLLSTDRFPFQSSELFKFFGFSRHSNFIQKLRDPFFKKEVIHSIDKQEKIGERKRAVLGISKKLFLDLVSEKHPYLFEKFEDVYLKGIASRLNEKFKRFGDSRKRRTGNYFHLYESHGYWNTRAIEIKGPYYMTSLSTDNYAYAIGTDPLRIYEVFLSWKAENPMFQIKTEVSDFYTGSRFIIYPDRPVARFDDEKHKNRIRFLAFLDFMYENGNLSTREKKMHLHFVELTRELLTSQLKLDIKYRNEIPDSNFIKDDRCLKKLYKKAAFIAHPDKGGNEEVFKKLNRAYQNHDIETVEKIYNSLK